MNPIEQAIEALEELVEYAETAGFDWSLDNARAAISALQQPSRPADIAANERNECAAIADELASKLMEHRDKDGAGICLSIRDAIKARTAEADLTCPRCGAKAVTLFSRAVEGEELETVHCGCLHAFTTPPPAPVLSDAERGVGACSMCGANVEDQIVKPALLSDAWQPIETAPKDRTLLLGYFNSHGKWRTLRGQWFSQESTEETWEEPEFAGEGWYETPVEIDDTPNCFWTEPTHWQPLPPPPIEQAIGRASREAK